MRRAYYTEEMWERRAPLFITLCTIGGLIFFAGMVYFLWLVIPDTVIEFSCDPDISWLLFIFILLALWCAMGIRGISLCFRHLSLYKLSQEGIIIKTLCMTSMIRWDEIQRIAIYTMYEERTSEIVGDYIVVCKKGKKMREYLVADDFFARRKSFFIIAYTEERASEFTPYWPEKICRGIQDGKINREK